MVKGLIMSENWLYDYVRLAFRIHKVVQTQYQAQFVEAYFGPPEWRQEAEAEPKMVPVDLVQQAMLLVDALPAQGFTSSRGLYLEKQVTAMEMLCRKLAGEAFSIEEEAMRCLDIRPIWTPEAQFAQAHALYEANLPGTGDLGERLRAYRTSLAFPMEQADLLKGFIVQAFAEARKRTLALMKLPSDETIEIQYPESGYEAAAYYQGDYRTRIDMNVTATAAQLPRLFDHKVCHEGYPGHHTEYILKEKYLYKQQGYPELAIVLTLCPQCTIAEGIALVAHEIIFALGEAEQWIAEHIYRAIGKDVDATILLSLRQASNMLGGVWDNAALLLDEGHPEAEAAQYFVRHMLLTEERAAQMVAHLKHPLWGLHNLTYMGGEKVVRRYLQGSEKVAAFRRLLTEQFVPSQLERSSA